MAIVDINEICTVSTARIMLIETGDMIDVSDKIVGIGVKNNYILNKMPLIEVSLKITEEIKAIIRDNEISLLLQCNVCNNTGDTNELDESTIYEKGILFSETIRIFEKPYTFASRVIDQDNTTSEGDISTAVEDVVVKLTGIIENIGEINHNIFNELYYNTTAISAAFNMLSRVGIKNIDIDGGYTTEIHQNILVPPMPPLLVLPYLQDYYNIFKHGINSYLDVGGKCFLFDPLQITSYQNVIQLNITSTNTSDMGSTAALRPTENTDNGNIYIQDLNTPSIVTGGKVTSYDLGSDVTFAAYDDVYNVVTREYSNNKSFKKKRIFWNPDNRIANENNLYVGSTRTEAFSYILTNINPYRIGPRTLFRVISPHPQVAGDYSVIEMDYTLEPQGTKSKYLSCMVFLTLSKIPNEND